MWSLPTRLPRGTDGKVDHCKESESESQAAEGNPHDLRLPRRNGDAPRGATGSSRRQVGGPSANLIVLVALQAFDALRAQCFERQAALGDRIEQFVGPACVS